MSAPAATPTSTPSIIPASSPFATAPPPMVVAPSSPNDIRVGAARGLLALGGAIAGAYFFPAHRVIGFLLGGGVMGALVTVVTGKEG